MKRLNRRSFLQSSAAKTGTALAAGALAAKPARAGANERFTVGVMGVRWRGMHLAAGFAGFEDVDVAAVCDVDDSVMGQAVKAVTDKQGHAPRTVRDYRRLLDDRSIDALVIGAPDHWHALATIQGCQAEKDVYVEKPVSHNVVEGRRMIQAARHYKKVVQVGTQRRSWPQMIEAMQRLRAGAIGKICMARTWIIHKRGGIGRAKDAATPKGVDYDLWLGPAPQRKFNANHFHKGWHWLWEYGTGELGNNGIHAADLARWGLGVTGHPIRVCSGGGNNYFNDDQETPDTHTVTWEYPGISLVWEHRLWSDHGVEGSRFGVAFYGDKGSLISDGYGWRILEGDKVVESAETLKRTSWDTDHLRNFLDCIRSRQRPRADIETGHLATSLCHLGNIAWRTKRTLGFDSETESFPGEPKANGLLERSYRRGFELPALS